MEFTKDTLEKYAKAFVQNLPSHTGGQAYVVGLKGNLGSGKTTFTQAVARALGVEQSVTSPTFVISQSYETSHPVFKRLVHVDAYRLSEEEGDTVGFGTSIGDPENVVLVEWPENLPKGVDFPAGAPMFHFETVDENTRRIEKHD